MLPIQIEQARVVAAAWVTRRNVLVVASGLVAILGIAAGVTLWLSAREQAAAAAYGEAIGRAQAALGPRAPAGAAATAVLGLEAALGAYPRAGLAGLAAYELGNLRYALRDYDRAVAAYETALAAGLPRPLRTLALGSIAAAWESRRDHGRAAESYRRALAELKPGGEAYESLQLDLARVLEASGRKDEAIETYRQVLRQAPNGVRAADARWRLASLGAAR